MHSNARPATSKKAFAVGDLLNDAATTPLKRSRPSGAFASTSSPDASSTPAARPLAAGPSRLKSSPAVPSTPSPSKGIPFSDRPNALSVAESYNEQLPLPTTTQMSGTKSRAVLSTTMRMDKYAYRYMYERMMERSAALDKAIDAAADLLQREYGIDEFGDPAIQSQEDVIVVGRICAESDSIKLTPTTTYLESSRMLGNGMRTLLNFDPDLKVRGGGVGEGGVGLFPGCLVGLTGRNGGGRAFTVSEVIVLPPPDAPYTAPSELFASQYGNELKQLGGAPLAVITASGPFTVDTDLEYAPLEALLKVVREEKPDVLILMGPFVDASHPLFVTGAVSQTPRQIFIQQITRRLLKAISTSPRTIIILVPNARDLLSTHVAFPQSPFGREELGLVGKEAKSIKCLPNPVSFSINEIIFSITSIDVLYHLRNQEMFRPALSTDSTEELPKGPKDMMGRTCRHLLRQRSFYPIFPAPLPSIGIDAINVDITHSALFRLAETGADIVILPSLLKAFTKVVDSTLMINPSFITRGSSGGTFARLSIHPLDRAELERRKAEEDEGVEHLVHERCRVDIVRI